MLGLGSANISATNNFTCNLLEVAIFPKSYIEHKLVCYPYSEVVCHLLDVENEVFSNITFFSELGLLRLCFSRKCIPFFNTIKPMTPVTRAQDKRLHSVYFMIPEKTIISALSLILGYLTS